MAQIYLNCGEYDKAIDELEYLLSLEALETPNSVKALQWVEPLKDLPRFQALLEKYKVGSAI